MKKILVFITLMILLVGCSQKKEETTFMLPYDDTYYALYNQDGEQLTDPLYKSFEEIEDIGYIITDENDQVGLISLNGKEIIPCGDYETLESTSQMFYATKEEQEETDDVQDEEDKDEQEETSLFQNSNLYILDNDGEVLYSADENTGIMKSGLPVIQTEDQYIVLYQQGEELYHDQTAVQYAYQGEMSAIIGFDDEMTLFVFFEDSDQDDIEMTIEGQGTYKIIAESVSGIVLNDEDAKSMIYVDLATQTSYQYDIAIQEATFDGSTIFLKYDDQVYIYQVGEKPVKMNTYFLSSSAYIIHSSDIYGPHTIYSNMEQVATLENCQLYPIAQRIYSEIFPVYVKDEGYQYYNFQGEKVIDQSYIYANPFDDCNTAIVQVSDDGYTLIDTEGNILLENEYYQIKYIGSSYYAIYNENGTFGIVNNNGNEVFAMEYTSLPETPIVIGEGYSYMLLTKNGRSYVYDMNEDMQEILSQEGDIVYNEKGYFQIGEQYYTLEGERIE